MELMHDTHGEAALDELREWVADEVEAISNITGTRSWRMLLDEDERWSTAQQRVFERSFLPHCPHKIADEFAVAVKVELVSDYLELDVQALAERVREQWELAGWATEQIAPGYFRADRADGAKMIIEGSDRPAGKRLSLIVQSACSADHSFAS